MTSPQPPCPRCGLVPVWPYGCPCGHVSASGTPSPPPYAASSPTSYPTSHPASYPASYPPPYPAPRPMVYRPGPAVVSEKSAGVAVLLSFLWLGAGHLYLGRTTPGVLLMLLHVFLWVLLVAVLPLGVLGWVATFVAVTVSCTSIAHEENARARSRVW